MSEQPNISDHPEREHDDQLSTTAVRGDAQARPNRQERAYVFSDEMRMVLETYPLMLPTNNQLRQFLKSRFNGVGFKNEFIGLVRRGEAVSESFLRKLIAYLIHRWPDELSSALSRPISGMSVDEFVAIYVNIATPESLTANRGKDLLSLGPAAVMKDMILTGIHIEGAGPLRPQDAELAALTLVASVGDACCEDVKLPPFMESVESGQRVLRQSFAETKAQVHSWIAHCPDSVWIKKHPDPEKTLLSMAMPLSEEAYDEFRKGDIDDVGLVDMPPYPRSSRILLLTASGDARNSRQRKLDLMVMVLNQLQRIMLPVTQQETKLVCLHLPGMLDKRARNWGFRNTGVVAERFAETRVHGAILPAVHVGELILPVPKFPSPNAIVWALFFLWQSYHSVSARISGDDRA